MRLGGPLFDSTLIPTGVPTPVGVQTPQEWVNAVRRPGYSAAYCPVGLDADLPVMLEHLPTAEEYILAASYIRSVARETGVKFTAGGEQ